MEHRLDCPVFDADNHLYEQADAFTRYLPDEYKQVIRIANVDGVGGSAVCTWVGGAC